MRPVRSLSKYLMEGLISANVAKEKLIDVLYTQTIQHLSMCVVRLHHHAMLVHLVGEIRGFQLVPAIFRRTQGLVELVSPLVEEKPLTPSELVEDAFVGGVNQLVFVWLLVFTV